MNISIDFYQYFNLFIIFFINNIHKLNRCVKCILSVQYWIVKYRFLKIFRWETFGFSLSILIGFNLLLYIVFFLIDYIYLYILTNLRVARLRIVELKSINFKHSRMIFIYEKIFNPTWCFFYSLEQIRSLKSNKSSASSCRNEYSTTRTYGTLESRTKNKIKTEREIKEKRNVKRLGKKKTDHFPSVEQHRASPLLGTHHNHHHHHHRALLSIFLPFWVPW